MVWIQVKNRQPAEMAESRANHWWKKLNPWKRIFPLHAGMEESNRQIHSLGIIFSMNLEHSRPLGHRDTLSVEKKTIGPVCNQNISLAEQNFTSDSEKANFIRQALSGGCVTKKRLGVVKWRSVVEYLWKTNALTEEQKMNYMFQKVEVEFTGKVVYANILLSSVLNSVYKGDDVQIIQRMLSDDFLSPTVDPFDREKRTVKVEEHITHQVEELF